MVAICCPETSVRNYHCSLRNMPEERSSQLCFGLFVFLIGGCRIRSGFDEFMSVKCG